jgi:Raf kinase inhibitor-like YbhB/YbcL family protein
MGNLKLTSSAFEDGGEIPREYGYKNGNREPQLTISGTPDGTKSLALIMDDPDAMEPAGKVWVHWVLWNIDHDTTDLSESLDVERAYRRDTMGFGMTDFGEVGYGGPAPPDKRHTYVFKLYALDSKLVLTTESTKADVEKAMEGHIIEQTQLTGTYAP